MDRKLSALVVASLAACVLAPGPGVPTAEAQPAISNVTVEPRGVSIRVDFDTNQDALCAVDYGLTDGYGNAAMQAPVAARQDHRVTVRGLQSSTDYHLRIGCLGEAFRSRYSEDRTARTLTKKVRVTFESLLLRSDSDFFGSGELFFTFDINGRRVHRWPNAGDADLSGPCGGWGQGCPGDFQGVPVETDLPQAFVRTVDPEDPSISVRVFGRDDDGPWNDDAEDSLTFAVPLDVESRSRTRTLHANDEDLHFHVVVTFEVFHE